MDISLKEAIRTNASGYRRQERELFYSMEEIRRLGSVLQCHEARFPIHVAIIRFLLLTACRKWEYSHFVMSCA